MYGRRLTFLNAYLSLAVVLIALIAEILLLCLIGKLSSLVLLWGACQLLVSTWTCCRQIIALRAGVPVLDTRVANQSKAASAFWEALVRGVIIALLPIAVLVLAIVYPVATLSRSDVLLCDGVLSVLGVWAYLWWERAAWEWRVNRGRVSSSEYVERISGNETALPTTDTGMRRYILELGWLVRYGPWIGGGLLYLPCLFMFYSGWGSAVGGMALSTWALAVYFPKHWKRARQDRETCQEALAEKLALATPVVTATVITEQKPLFQQLGP